MLYIVSILSLILSASLPAAAASSQWLESEGGAVRLVTSGLADEGGRLRGALQIELKPGWKTYWRDPGESGVPPQIELSGSPGVTGVEVLFPPPVRVADAYATWAGYKHSVALPVVFTLTTPGTAGIIEGSVFLGICETICIPFQAPFSFDAGADPDNAADAMVVQAAFAALPVPARPGFEVTGVSRKDGHLLLRAELPEGAGEAALFIAAPEGTRLATPVLEERKGAEATFSAEILSAPDNSAQLDYTLVVGEEAASGTIALP